MGVGGPIVFVGGVMFGFAGAVPGVGAGATGTVALGAAACAGVVVVADGAVGAGAGVVARVRCAAAQLVQLKIAISRMNCLVIGFLLGNIAAVLTGMPFL
jgi:hypothetical protein